MTILEQVNIQYARNKAKEREGMPQYRYLHTVCISLAMAVVSASSQAGLTYRITDIGHLPGVDSHTLASKLNNAGQVVGSNGSSAVIWSPSDGLQNLGTLPLGVSSTDDYSSGWGINNAEQVVGTSFDSFHHMFRGFTWTSESGMQEIGLTSAHDINDGGQAVGSMPGPTSGRYRAAMWSAETGVQELSGQPANALFDSSVAMAISNSGYVAGYTYRDGDINPYLNAFVWSEAEGFRVLAELSPIPYAWGNSVAKDINNSGQAIGYSSTRAYIWNAADGMRDIGDLGGGNARAEANGINDAGMVVGESILDSGESLAFIWSANDGMVSLTDLVDPADPWNGSMALLKAYDINEAGQIVALGWMNNTYRTVLLTPVPEPGSWSMLLIGLLAVPVAIGRRRVHMGRSS